MCHYSIIIPMYNVAPFIERAITSVYNQGLLEDAFELILIDDGSPDESAEIAKKITSGRSNVQLISQENKGLGGARNTGINNAKGKYILFLDADDYYFSDMLCKLKEEIIHLNLDIVEFGAKGIQPDGELSYKKSLITKTMDGVEYYNTTRYMDSACNKLYKKSFLINHDLKFIERIYIEDYEFNTRAFFYAKKVKGVPLVVSGFFQSSNSITRTADFNKIEKMKSDIIHVIEIINYFYKSKKETLKPKEVVYFKQRLSYLTTTLFYQLWKNNYSYESFVSLKETMRLKDLFYVNETIFNSKKNVFRIILLKNFTLLKMLLLLKIINRN